MDIIEEIKGQIEKNDVVLYMKGTPQFPMCGFSARVAQALNELNTKYAFVNILERQDIRQSLPKYANWPTFPQLYVKSELVGGCDIVMEMFERGELEKLLSEANATTEGKPEFNSVG